MKSRRGAETPGLWIKGSAQTIREVDLHELAENAFASDSRSLARVVSLVLKSSTIATTIRDVPLPIIETLKRLRISDPSKSSPWITDFTYPKVSVWPWAQPHMTEPSGDATVTRDVCQVRKPSPDSWGDLNGSLQHWLGVYSPESQTPTFFVDAALSLALPGRVALRYTRKGPFF